MLSWDYAKRNVLSSEAAHEVMAHPLFHAKSSARRYGGETHRLYCYPHLV